MQSLNKTEAADILGVSLTTMDRYLREGMPVDEAGDRGEPYRICGCRAFHWRSGRKMARELDVNLPSPAHYVLLSFAIDEVTGLDGGDPLRHPEALFEDHGEALGLSDRADFMAALGFCLGLAEAHPRIRRMNRRHDD